MNKNNIIKSIVLFVITTALLIVFFVWKRVFTGELEKQDLYRVLCDGFFIASVLYLSFAALQFVSSRGEFDSFKYGIKNFFHIHKPTKNFENNHQTYGDYVAEKNKTRRFKANIELYVGIVLLIAAIVLYLLYKFSK